jgi:hypothetical protein
MKNISFNIFRKSFNKYDIGSKIRAELNSFPNIPHDY